MTVEQQGLMFYLKNDSSLPPTWNISPLPYEAPPGPASPSLLQELNLAKRK